MERHYDAVRLSLELSEGSAQRLDRHLRQHFERVSKTVSDHKLTVKLQELFDRTPDKDQHGSVCQQAFRRVLHDDAAAAAELKVCFDEFHEQSTEDNSRLFLADLQRRAGLISNGHSPTHTSTTAN